MNKELLYCIPAGQYGKEGVLSLLAQHPEIRFVSLIGVDLAGNDTDEKIPIEIFIKDYDDFFAGKAVQTDGSSVVFMNIATLNDARVDFVADNTVNWYVDYNDENIDMATGLPVGTLRIPSFLTHKGVFTQNSNSVPVVKIISWISSNGKFSMPLICFPTSNSLSFSATYSQDCFKMEK